MTLRRARPYWAGKGVGGFEPEYQAVLDRASFLGYTLPSSTQSNKNNLKIKHLKDLGIWSEFDLFYVFNQESGLDDFCKLNWVDPTVFELYNPTPANEPTHAADSGFQGGTDLYFLTNYEPRNDRVKLSVNDGYMGYSITNIPSTFVQTAYIAGARNNNDAGQIYVADGDSSSFLNRFFISRNQTGSQGSENAFWQDFKDSTVGGSGTFNVYEDGVFQSGPSTTVSNVSEEIITSFELALLGMNVSGTIFPSSVDFIMEYFHLAKGTTTEPFQLEIYEILTETYTP